MMDNLPQRKQLRLKDYDYSQEGHYFVTICTQDRQNILCDVGDAAHGVPQITQTGQMVLQYLQNIGTAYKNVILDCYIMMPNHIHCIIASQNGLSPKESGSPWAATPTMTIPKIVNSFKTLTSKKYGQTLCNEDTMNTLYETNMNCKKLGNIS